VAVAVAISNTATDTIAANEWMVSKLVEDGEDGESAGQYSVHTNIEEVLKFNTGELIQGKIKYRFSADVI